MILSWHTGQTGMGRRRLGLPGLPMRLDELKRIGQWVVVEARGAAAAEPT
jgi:hypothetical protein